MNTYCPHCPHCTKQSDAELLELCEKKLPNAEIFKIMKEKYPDLFETQNR